MKLIDTYVELPIQWWLAGRFDLHFAVLYHPPKNVAVAGLPRMARESSGRGECLSFTLLLLLIHSFLLILHYNFKRISIDTSGGRLSGGRLSGGRLSGG